MISRWADSGESEPCAALAVSSVPYTARMLSGASWSAAFESVGPSSVRHPLMPPERASTAATTGPLLMCVTSLPKKSLPLCSA